MKLKGWRTHISAFLASLPTGVGSIVAQFDPELVLQAVQHKPVPLLVYQGLTLLATWYFRSEASAIDPEIKAVIERVTAGDDELISAVNELSTTKPDESAIGEGLSELEQELSAEIGGEYER